MSLKTTPVCDLGRQAIDFNLPGIDGRQWTLEECRGENATLVMFICNHCPYVKAIRKLLVRDTRELLEHGVKSVAIMSNDTLAYPEDSFDNMGKVAREFAYPFPYLLDESQEVGKAYGAACTPDFFGFDRMLTLQYRGRLDETTPSNTNPEARRELFEAMCEIAATGKGPEHQIPGMGCSIKWRV